MSSHNSDTVEIESINAHNITDFLKHMDDGDSLEMVKVPGGVVFKHVKTTTTGGKVAREKAVVNSTILQSVGFTNVRANWISTPPSLSSGWKDFGKDPRKVAKKKPGISHSDNGLIGAYKFLAATAGVDPVAVTRNLSNYMMYQFDGEDVYFRGDEPVFFVDKATGKEVYLHKTEKREESKTPTKKVVPQF